MLIWRIFVFAFCMISCGVVTSAPSITSHSDKEAGNKLGESGNYIISVRYEFSGGDQNSSSNYPDVYGSVDISFNDISYPHPIQGWINIFQVNEKDNVERKKLQVDYLVTLKNFNPRKAPRHINLRYSLWDWDPSGGNDKVCQGDVKLEMSYGFYYDLKYGRVWPGIRKDNDCRFEVVLTKVNIIPGIPG